MDKLILKSPAKVNLYLNVLNKRRDGYHNIETIFEKISLFDIITIKPEAKGIRITTDNPGLPVDKRNLAYRAAALLFKQAKVKKGIRIDIKKNIPLASGLGGGSSNAAMTLLGINRLYGLGLGRKELSKIGRSLGADVPFFLQDRNFALGAGRGDEIRPLYTDINIWHIIVLFRFGMSTKAVYGALNLRLTPTPVDVKIPLLFAVKNDVENLANSLYNKLEEVALRENETIRAAKGLLLKSGALNALMSGSGSTIFGVTKTREEAVAVKNRFKKVAGDKCRVLVVDTFNG